MPAKGNLVNINVIVLFGFLILTTGCAIHDGRPPVARYTPEAQHKLKSVTHWQIVADDIASQIEPVAKAGNQSVFVPTTPATSFSKVFSSQLRSSLLKKGVRVSSAESGALVINVNVDEVRHVTLDRYKPGTLTALAAGVLVLREATDSLRSTIGAGAALLVAADAYRTFTELDKRPSTEIVITTTAEKNAQFAIHKTDAYYIDSVDSSLFTETGRQFPVVKAGEQ